MLFDHREQDEPDEVQYVLPGLLGELVELLRYSGLNIPDEVRDVRGLTIAVKANPKQQRDVDLLADEVFDDFPASGRGRETF